MIHPIRSILRRSGEWDIGLRFNELRKKAVLAGADAADLLLASRHSFADRSDRLGIKLKVL